MSDRDDTRRRPDAIEEAEGTPEEATTLLDEPLDAEATTDEPMPQGPNQDASGLAGPPTETSMPRTSDDDDLDPEGGGLSDTPLRPAYEAIARRADLARRLEDLLTEVQEWAQDDGSDTARWISETLADAYEQLDAPPEDSDDEPDVQQAEASDLGTPRR